MTDITETITRFKAVCAELNCKPCPYINRVLEKEKLDAEEDYKDSMHMSLAGNNHLMTNTRINDQDVQVLYKTLYNNMYVTSIDLRYNHITDEGAKAIGKLLEETPLLRELNLMCNEIGEAGAEAIARALQINESLVFLRMNGNKIGNKGGMYFAQMLQVNMNLEQLDVGDCDLEQESVIALGTVLTQNQTLRALNVNRPILFSHQEECTVHMAKTLKVNRTLREIHMQKYDMRDFGATRLAENLMGNYTLRYLDLSCNRITRDGTFELAKFLKMNTPLEILDLGYNRLEDDGAIHLADALTTFNTNLQTLVICYNNISSKGLCAIADCMKFNMGLQAVYIWGNNLEEPAAIAFSGLLQTERLLPKNTDVRPYVVDGITILSQLNHHIRRHYYWKPSYGDDVPPPKT
ncbi:leucine-rich repeat-containing protein 34 isoform X2 [Lingula anatina]|uniref:Leucine-rich repeat-containing protein 34 isoform X2 n=1 Tax=Lingula anatina TaxID=7574 RepID=A0A1S3K293_LINAN|nr:leucine-rich repeat-containing protein 34 isoform X2 [Lingula anatina]|eukprot:XP_013416637.1 leucine-rich repeat-containing protein 34 isoform X2 [Lingula anatina]